MPSYRQLVLAVNSLVGNLPDDWPSRETAKLRPERPYCEVSGTPYRRQCGDRRWRSRAAGSAA